MKTGKQKEWINRSEKVIEECKVDEECEYEGGIDEAGRGPVLGPMVYSICLWPVKYKQQLATLGFNDSKQLTEDDRNILFNILQRLQTHHLIKQTTIELSAEYLSNKMLQQDKYNLNAISHDTAIKLIEQWLKQGVQLKHVMLDTVGNPTTYQQILVQRFNTYPSTVFTVTQKADSKYPIVGAASILAKVTRDNTIHTLQTLYNDPLGSGYPADPKTQNFINKNCDRVFGFPVKLVRYSWKTIENILQEKQKYNEAIKIEFKDHSTQVHSFTNKQRPELIHKVQLSSSNFSV